MIAVWQREPVRQHGALREAGERAGRRCGEKVQDEPGHGCRWSSHQHLRMDTGRGVRLSIFFISRFRTPSTIVHLLPKWVVVHVLSRSHKCACAMKNVYNKYNSRLSSFSFFLSLFSMSHDCRVVIEPCSVSWRISDMRHIHSIEVLSSYCVFQCFLEGSLPSFPNTSAMTVSWRRLKRFKWTWLLCSTLNDCITTWRTRYRVLSRYTVFCAVFNYLEF